MSETLQEVCDITHSVPCAVSDGQDSAWDGNTDVESWPSATANGTE